MKLFSKEKWRKRARMNRRVEAVRAETLSVASASTARPVALNPFRPNTVAGPSLTMADMPRSSDSPVLAAEQALRPDRRLVPPTVGEWVQIYQKATPEQLIGWRLSAQMGNWWASYMLTSRMEADWPVLRDALHEIGRAHV